eukprot:6180527-Pleurochrysis_carterae.AAC.2
MQEESCYTVRAMERLGEQKKDSARSSGGSQHVICSSHSVRWGAHLRVGRQSRWLSRQSRLGRYSADLLASAGVRDQGKTASLKK